MDSSVYQIENFTKLHYLNKALSEIEGVQSVLSICSVLRIIKNKEEKRVEKEAERHQDLLSVSQRDAQDPNEVPAGLPRDRREQQEDERRGERNRKVRTRFHHVHPERPEGIDGSALFAQ